MVFRHTTDAIRNSAHTDSSLAQSIAEQYMADVAPGERILQFHVGVDADSTEKALKANGQIIARIRNGTVKMPVDLEESWVRALPPQWRDACARELARRYGFLGARIPMMEPHAGVLAVARLSVEFGHTLEALTNILADGRICPKDIPELRRALDEIGQLEAELITAKRYVTCHLHELAPRAVVGGAA
ncbi:hypothetical protein [Stenotrophomonas geniculata]|uniref:hypothetical protein n=1 Tax=Stenotrophomonas geniculata TaxID=86188 RepID=UPI0009E81E4A|nr:hypothetical protein [Stenotrophomonas geniculata]MBN5137696.1 hypothetical protein [Stenotrophomonas maltophilia]